VIAQPSAACLWLNETWADAYFLLGLLLLLCLILISLMSISIFFIVIVQAVRGSKAAQRLVWRSGSLFTLAIALHAISHHPVLHLASSLLLIAALWVLLRSDAAELGKLRPWLVYSTLIVLLFFAWVDFNQCFVWGA
jgi:hypothetical protein